MRPRPRTVAVEVVIGAAAASCDPQPGTVAVEVVIGAAAAASCDPQPALDRERNSSSSGSFQSRWVCGGGHRPSGLHKCKSLDESWWTDNS